MKFFFCARIGIYMMNKSKMEIFWTYISRWNGKNPKTENMPPAAFPACFGTQGYCLLVEKGYYPLNGNTISNSIQGKILFFNNTHTYDGIL